MCLAEVAARVRNIHLHSGRHLLVENPAGSELFWLLCSEATWNTGKVVKINVSQCALGLRVHEAPIYKNTTFLASRILFLKFIHGATCRCSSHGCLE